jgi:hypothetical protein
VGDLELPEEWVIWSCLKSECELDFFEVFGPKSDQKSENELLACPYMSTQSYSSFPYVRKTFGSFDNLAETREFGQNTYPDIVYGGGIQAWGKGTERLLLA